MTLGTPSISISSEAQRSDEFLLIGKNTRSTSLGLGYWLPVIWMVFLLFTVIFADILPIQNPKSMKLPASSLSITTSAGMAVVILMDYQMY